ncbi:unnamed protein product [marine sediment metagenome]|uniref:Uncharacterized protein n=1 Tax=marine sediment metagenome TaxID=412755 RepID=X0ZIK2_9ZZZZ
MKIDLKNTATQIILAGTLITMVFGVSFASVLNRGRAVWEGPQINARQDTIIAKQNAVIIKLRHDSHWIEHAQEMNFQLLRLMTDDRDTRRYKITIENSGIEYNVDVRETAERVKLAFVDKLDIVYPIYIDHADGRMYIIFHNIDDNENQNIYLERI